MSTLVYAPGIRVYIDTYKHGIVDVSDDLINGAMQRRSDGVSQFQFQLNNARRKYDRVFVPNDRIIVMMKRITWMQVFTGYLNELPMFTSWPRVVPMQASCSLKRLQYFYWDPTIAASSELVRTSLINDQTGVSAPDGGIKQAVINLLEEVVDWSGARATDRPELKGSKVHIGGIPKTWFDLASKLRAEVLANIEEEKAVAQQLLEDAGGLGSVAGQEYDNGVVTGSSFVPQGTYDGKTFDAEQVANASIIIRTVAAEGGTPLQIAQTLATAMQEASLRVLDKGDAAGPDSRGLYQQRDNGAWGTYSDRMNPEISTRNFFKVFKEESKKVSASAPFWLAIYKTQRCAPSVKTHYSRWEGAAKAMLAAYNSTASLSVTGQDPAFAANAAGGTGTGRITGRNLAAQARALVNSRPIPYGHGTSGTEQRPTELDCSAFTRHVLFRATGSIGTMPRKASDIFAWAIKSGGKRISMDEARKTPGAIIGVTSNGAASGVHHMEISLGGNMRAGAHQKGRPASVETIPGSYFNIAALLPGVSYSSSDASAPTAGTGTATRSTPTAKATREDRQEARDAQNAGTETRSQARANSGAEISDAERQQLFGPPGDLTNRTSYKTPWGFTVQGIHRSIAGVFADACEAAAKASTYVPAQMQFLPELDSSGLPRRPIRGRTAPPWSLHSYGLAVDIFSTFNIGNDAFASTFAPDVPFRNAFKERGFRLGADYKGRKDFPHIEWIAAPPDGSGTFVPGGDPTAVTSGESPLFTTAAEAGTDASNPTLGEGAGLQSASELDSMFGSVPWINTKAFQTSGEGNYLVGIRRLMNDTPILGFVKNLCNSTLRSFCSAPNGDFIAWFPDYYGHWKTAGKMVLQPIEVKDFTVTWSDEHLVTHQFVSAALPGQTYINFTDGSVGATELYKRTVSAGICTIEMPGVMPLLFGNDESTEEHAAFVSMILQRFGARPKYDEMPNLTGPNGEFFMAVFLFMQGWAYQFNANIDITFMPELYPGMLVQFPAYNFQAYVVQVDHSFDFSGGGFMTTINISSPAKINPDGDTLYGLPVATEQGTNPLRDKLDSPESVEGAPPLSGTPTSSPTQRAATAAVEAKLNRLAD